MSTPLSDLAHGFRHKYLDYAELTHQLRAWADAFPHLVRLESIGQSGEGRDIWLLVIGPDPDRARPAVWVDGNMHASEVMGSSAALAIAEDVLRLHLEPQAELHGLPEHVKSGLRDVLFYVLPRISPDGAEEVLKTGRWLRSVPRDNRPDGGQPRWKLEDVDGDGRALLMRKQDPCGDFVATPEGRMRRRRLEDVGPYYLVYPEGVIEHFDGVHVPAPTMLSDHAPDLNRNFPWAWAPEHEQLGAGDYPGSEPESRAVLEYTTRLPSLFAWLNFHTFGGVFIRPRGDVPDNKMDQGDLAIFKQLEAWAEEFTGYPVVSGYEEFTYEPDKPLRGDMSDYGYHQRGAIAYVCELWDFFRQIGMDRKHPFVHAYSHASDSDHERAVEWDKLHNHGRVFQPWKTFSHPQLGELEVGGLLPLVGIWNPPYERIDEVCQAQSACFLRVAALCPRIVLRVEQQSLGDGLHRLDCHVENLGYLASYGLPSAKQLEWNTPPCLEIELPASAELVSPSGHIQELPDLEGWGRGYYASAVHYPRSSGGSLAVRSFVVRGHGEVELRVGCPRVGFVQRQIKLTQR
ncbi:MAG: M14 family metallopeptidase [Polyangiaceae bacterium]